MAIGGISLVVLPRQHLQRDDDVGEGTRAGDRYPALDRHGKRRGETDVPV